MGNSKAFRFGAAFAAVGMMLSSTAHAAPSSFSAADPLVSLSVFGTSSSRAAVCAAGTAAAGAAATAAATAAQAGPGPGCVLPVLGQAPPPVAEVPIVTPIVEEVSTGLGSLLPIAGLAGLGLLALLLLNDDDDDDDDDDGISPT